MYKFAVGQVVRLTWFFKVAGVLTDATTVTLLIRHSRQVEGTTYDMTTAPNIAHDSLGQYHFDFKVTESGPYYWNVQTTGPVETADEGVFYGEDSPSLRV